MKVQLLLVVAVLGLASAQKLFFKSNRELLEARVRAQKAKEIVDKGFGFKETRHYFTHRLTALEMAKAAAGVVVCPDKQSACPDGNTCCLLATKKYGCCAMMNAVCCQDGIHCCPFGTKCDIVRQACTRAEMELPWAMKESAFTVSLAEEYHQDSQVTSQQEKKADLQGDSVMCPDGASYCQDGDTCCKKPDGDYACCPIASAVCCTDGVHCCPSGYKCDLSAGRCVKQGDRNHVIDMFLKRPAKTQLKSIKAEVVAVSLGGVKCQDGESECPTGNTCCKLSSGQYGCCPLSEAVCCSDGVHCCPHGTTCDLSSGKCDGGSEKIDWFEKQPARQVGAVKCDTTHECPSGNTCCKLPGGNWGCCPLPEAVCCSDGVHCCPHGTTCDLSSGKCDGGSKKIDWFEKQPARQVGAVKCDSTHECPSGNTCCKLPGGNWGCCPLPEAVCCSDGVHCCPHGTTCDLSSGKCDGGSEKIDWFEKQPARQVGAVKCDSTHECPSGNTCCKLPGGNWGCCPLPEAVCCSDGVHCCPHGTTCDLSSGKCDGGSEKIDWFEKQPARQVGAVKCDTTHECPTGNTCCDLGDGQWGCCPTLEAVCCDDHVHCCPHDWVCDGSSGNCTCGNRQMDWLVKQPARQVGAVKCDSTHECPTGNTCCELGNGEWGCCPLPEAVCCGDHVHCCPHDTTCDVSSGKCNRGNTQIDWFEKQPALQVGAVKCDQSHECPTGNTCCKLGSGEWGCCPLSEAVCCGDHVHCCPHDTTCDVSSGKCNRGNTQIDWFEKQPALQVGAVKCDSTHECPSGNTCCKLSSGQWGCCPLPKAVCCSDEVHCCPEDTTCDTGSGKCNRGNTQIDWFEKQPALQVGAVKCDSTHECPSGDTCCKLSSGQWGCCPLPKAVCCSDEVHCCPEDTTCDTGSGKCNRGNTQIDWFEKQPALQVGAVKCDSTHECPSGDTCCKLSSGQWGCCPLPKAVCCSDEVHCCPEDTTCDTGSGKCNRGNTLIDWFEKQPALQVGAVKCDSTHECPSGDTCCKLSSGQWGCCPLPKAVCCSDEVHCCPEDTTCDTGSGKCIRGNTQIDWFEKQPALQVGAVKCDSTHECPSGDTCCKLSSGQWGCCPLPQAVCCSDEVHCCPEDTTCDTGSGKCNRGNTQIDWFEKQPALQVEAVKCDSTHECPSGNTCCKLSSGQWGCCPLPKAVCCSDEVHCCPEDTTCDTGSGKCNRGNTQIDWFEKQPALQVGAVKCDSTHECPSGDTCCKLSSGQWGCCPLPKAVCCSDEVHCCPEDTTCDTGSGKCNRGNTQIDWFEKQPALQVGAVKCDSTHECPSGDTCCKLSSGQWGCCPLPKAVCCSDEVHCCPEDTTCDTGSGKCNRGNTQIDWFEKQPALQVEAVKCDSTHECPSGNTCCKLSSGQWGCCPLPKAVCCSDEVHCCPEDTTCDTGSGKCNRGNTQIDWFEKQPARQVGAVKCDSTHECPSGDTCCKLSSGQWGCCPLPKAVCCSDEVHCCPEDTTCDTGSGKCNRGNTQIDWFEKQPALQVGAVKCDSTHECPSGDTCCKLSSGQWGCCPLQEAVCCSDEVHCCPHDTTCDVSSGKCNRGNTQLDWFEKRPARPVSSIRCDDETECPDGSTCCQMAGGGWGCCPMPSAVCCSDGVHCCPSGYTCDTQTGTCSLGNQQQLTPISLLDVICKDGSECLDGQTCCKMDDMTGSYGCCPMPNAVCCSDDQHCCPHGYRCDMTKAACVKGLVRFPWVGNVKRAQRPTSVSTHKQPAANQNRPNSTPTKACSLAEKCKNSAEACCDYGENGYLCCDYNPGVCCVDHQHCCPHGYICDQGPNICRIPETATSASAFLLKLHPTQP